MQIINGRPYWIFTGNCVNINNILVTFRLALLFSLSALCALEWLAYKFRIYASTNIAFRYIFRVLCFFSTSITNIIAIVSTNWARASGCVKKRTTAPTNNSDDVITVCQKFVVYQNYSQTQILKLMMTLQQYKIYKPVFLHAEQHEYNINRTTARLSLLVVSA